jgi:hypothetical protein
VVLVAATAQKAERLAPNRVVGQQALDVAPEFILGGQQGDLAAS